MVEISSQNIIFMDTAPFIYYFENNSQYTEKLRIFFDQVYDKDIQIVTSLITYIEIITKPLKTGNKKLAAKYRDYFLNSAQLSIYPIDIMVAEETARIRAKYNVKTPDALQIATAICCGADYIITHDFSWSQVQDIPIIIRVDEL